MIEVVPNKVISAIGAFANVKTVKQAEKVMFHEHSEKISAKKFLTQKWSLSGVYETARLDSETYTVNVKISRWSNYRRFRKTSLMVLKHLHQTLWMLLLKDLQMLFS